MCQMLRLLRKTRSDYLVATAEQFRRFASSATCTRSAAIVHLDAGESRISSGRAAPGIYPAPETRHATSSCAPSVRPAMLGGRPATDRAAAQPIPTHPTTGQDPLPQ